MQTRLRGSLYAGFDRPLGSYVGGRTVLRSAEPVEILGADVLVLTVG